MASPEPCVVVDYPGLTSRPLGLKTCSLCPSKAREEKVDRLGWPGPGLSSGEMSLDREQIIRPQWILM